MTLVAVALSVVAYVLVRSVSLGWTEQVRQTPDNRIVTRNKMGWQGTLPVHYIESVRQFPGVRRALRMRWGYLALPDDRTANIASHAVDPEPFVAMHYELHAPQQQKDEFISNRRSMLVSAELAEEYGWALGDIVHFKSRKLPIDIDLTVAGIFQSVREGFARRAVYFHWDYLNELLPERERNQVNILVSEIEEPKKGAHIAKALDMEFERIGGQALSEEDQAVNAQLVGQYGAILSALDFVGVLMLGIVLLILGNTLGMAIRERSKEYGVLRAIGFRKRQIMGLILGEAVLLGLLGGTLGVVLAYPLLEHAASDYIQRTMKLAPLKISLSSALSTVVVGGVLGGFAGVVPAYQLIKNRLWKALRHIG